ncbi:MAG: HEAT repeat domain-containing protein [Chloroflexi bacterium]|nr:HEAT repeat domain-containing protein [Chloroflexota bacterium]
MSPAIEEILAELGDNARPLLKSRLAGLNDLSAANLETFKRSWGTIDFKRRREIVSRLLELAADNVEMNFDGIFKLCLKDEDPVVIEKAIEGLWENEETSLINLLLTLLDGRYPAKVQAAAALALGKFAMLAEHGKINASYSSKLVEGLLGVFNDRSREIEVRRRVLEALAPISVPPVRDAIKEAYRSGVLRLVVSAIYAMGNSCDAVWMPALLAELANDDAERRYEAAVACGELEEKAAVPKLSVLTDDPDIDVSLAAVQALGRIGGSEAKRSLELCLRSSRAAVQQAACEALGELVVGEDPLSIPHEIIEQGYDYRQ